MPKEGVGVDEISRIETWTRIEDVFPIENGDVLAGYVSLAESTLPETNQYPLKNDGWKMTCSF